MQEIWKDIEGYEGKYMASNLGNIKSMKYLGKLGERNLKPGRNQWGYCYCILSKYGKPKSIRVHRVIGKMFIENPDNKRELNHIDGDKMNNSVANLERVSPQENTMHKLYVLDKGRKRSVHQYDLLGCLLNTRPSIRMAGRETGVGHYNIQEVLKGKQRTAGGYKWQYNNT